MSSPERNNGGIEKILNGRRKRGVYAEIRNLDWYADNGLEEEEAEEFYEVVEGLYEAVDELSGRGTIDGQEEKMLNDQLGNIEEKLPKS